MDFQNDTNTLANIGTITVTGNTLTISSTGSINLPTGTTAQRPSSTASAGSLRYNTSISSLEAYSGVVWNPISSTLGGLTDITITSPTNGQVLSYDSTLSEWINSNGQTITLTGDVTGSGVGSFATTLAASGVTAGTYTGVTVDSKGRVTAGTTTQPWTSITATPTTIAGYGITNAVTTTTAHAGDVTGTYNALTLANTGVTAGTYNKVTVNAKGLVTGATSLLSADVTTALGYTPLNPGGSASISGSLAVAGTSAFTGAIAANGGITGLPSTGLISSSAIPLAYLQANYIDFAVGGGQIVQSVNSVVPAATASTTYTLANTTPPVTTGTQVWSNSITPALSTSKVRITGAFNIATSTAGRSLIAFVFRGSTCIGVFGGTCSTANTFPSEIGISLVDSPATTSATTYSIRVAATSATTWYVNQLNAAFFNGLMAQSIMTLQELT